MTDAPDWEGFGRDLMQDWPVRDVDGCELFEAALRNGLLRQVTGGYDPEQHIDAECICPETGDPWYEYAFPHTRADLATPMRCAECDCEKGGADCNWIATPTPLDDPRVKALVEAVRHEREMVCQDFDMQSAAARAVDAALSALEENK